MPKSSGDILYASEINRGAFIDLPAIGSAAYQFVYTSGVQFVGLAAAGPGSVLYTSGTAGLPYWGYPKMRTFNSFNTRTPIGSLQNTTVVDSDYTAVANEFAATDKILFHYLRSAEVGSTRLTVRMSQGGNTVDAIGVFNAAALMGWGIIAQDTGSVHRIGITFFETTNTQSYNVVANVPGVLAAAGTNAMTTAWTLSFVSAQGEAGAVMNYLGAYTQLKK